MIEEKMRVWPKNEVIKEFKQNIHWQVGEDAKASFGSVDLESLITWDVITYQGFTQDSLLWYSWYRRQVRAELRNRITLQCENVR